MIVITGGNGQLGRAISNAVEQTFGASSFRLSVRQVAQNDDRIFRGVEIREADFDSPSALARSFEGARQLVLVSTDGTDDTRLTRHLNAVRAAGDAGVDHIVFTSSSTVGKRPGLSHAEVNARTEDAISKTGAKYTILRNNLYSELLMMFAAPALQTGAIRLPAGSGSAAMISRPDIARFIAVVLGAGFPRDRVFELTGPDAYGYADLAAVLSEMSNKPIRYEAAEPNQAIDWLRGKLPVPDFYIPLIVDAAREFAEGWLAPVSADFPEVTGVAARPAVLVWRSMMRRAASQD